MKPREFQAEYIKEARLTSERSGKGGVAVDVSSKSLKRCREELDLSIS